jgi:hypothetical protein
VVIEKAEKEQSSRRKRKNVDSSVASKLALYNTNGNDAPRRASMMAMPTFTPGSAAAPVPMAMSATNSPQPTAGTAPNVHMSDHLSPSSFSERGPSHSPIMIPTGETSPSLGSAGWPHEFPVPRNGDNDSFSNTNGFTPGVGSPPSIVGGPIAQPLLPQDLFSLPMTLDWNWAEMSGGAYPSVENGNFDSAYQGGPMMQ